MGLDSIDWASWRFLLEDLLLMFMPIALRERDFHASELAVDGHGSVRARVWK